MRHKVATVAAALVALLCTSPAAADAGETLSLAERNAQLNTLIAVQEQRLADLAADQRRLALLAQQWRGLLANWIDDFAALLASSPPVRLNERGAALAAARAALEDPEMLPAQQVDAVFDLVAGQLDLWSQTGAYAGFVDDGGEPRAVQFVHLGAVFLGYHGADDSRFYWSGSGWLELPASYAADMEALERIAAGRSPARLLTLPVNLSAPPSGAGP